MPQLTIEAAAEMVEPSKATLYRDIKAGKLSVTTDPRGKTVVDTAELDRVYGLIHTPETSHPEPESDTLLPVETAPTHAENLETIERLKAEVRRCNDRTDKLIDLLSIEQARTEKVLALPAPKQEKQLPGWLRIFGFGSN